MKVGISQLVLGREARLSEWLPMAREAGYECFEALLTDAGDLTMDSGPAEYRRLLDLSKASGVELVSLCASLSHQGSLTSGQPGDRERFRAVAGKMAEAAQALGIDAVLVIPGGVSADVRYDVAYQRALEGMRGVAPLAERAGVTLAIEYVWNNLFLSPLEMRRFLDEVGSPRVGFYMDPGNMAIFGYPEHWIEIVGSHIKRVHFKDWSRSARNWPPLTQGDLEWPKIMSALRAIPYDGPVISEVDGDWEAHRRTAETMREILAL
ncbi:MAG TPA: sugar phosphate isomerase/epimerase family protein [Armatimonadota bacterium]|jgi:hexulose-6-phosphate isomerase